MPSKVSSGNIAATASDSAVQSVKGSEWLTVIGKLGSAGTPAGAVTDINVFVNPYLEDDSQPTNIAGVGLSADATTTSAAVVAGVIWQVRRFRLGGVQKVKISLQNANASTALPGQFDWFIS